MRNSFGSKVESLIECVLSATWAEHVNSDYTLEDEVCHTFLYIIKFSNSSFYCLVVYNMGIRVWLNLSS